MAGVQWNTSGAGQQRAPAGHQYDPTRGGYVSISALEDEQRRRQLQANADADRLRNQNMEDTDRALESSRYTDNFRRQELLDNQGRQSAQDASDFARERFVRGREDLLRLTGEGEGSGAGGGSGSGGGGQAPPIAGPSDADRAYYTRAKESTGRSMSSALKGLAAMMQRRNISGSGI